MAARLWHKAPFVRLLLALSGGIVLQWHAQFSLASLTVCFSVCLLFLALYSFTPLRRRYQLALINGVLLCLLFAAAGGLLAWLNDVRNEKNWVGREYANGDALVLTLQEPLIEKNKSFRALASFDGLVRNDSLLPVSGKLILYFKKDSLPVQLGYGSRLMLRRPLQEIKNAGNPGSFNYRQYCLFNGITHQLYLTKEDIVLLPQAGKSLYKDLVFQSRQWVVQTIRRYIAGEKEQGLAEALLIGYKDDLDKDLVQAYSNTGVVHVIAISGLHLGLIYWLLMLLTKPWAKARKWVWVRLLLIVVVLWAFSFLAGASPSVLRSAVMFSVIAAGEVVLRRTNVFNTLAFSALVLLCINPFWLWDVGFQLSYAAVLSIILFFRPVYNWFPLPNKAIDFWWKLTAVTIAAQILTLPISIYHFHQMPLLFVFTNLVAVPLSSLILLGEILLCALAFLPAAAQVTGAVLQQLIFWMNSYIEGFDGLPFSVLNGLSISLLQAVLLLIFCVAFCYWLMEKQRRFAWMALSAFAGFMVLRASSFYEAYQQRKLIVYNVPKHTAIDVIDGQRYWFVGDTVLLYDEALRNFHLQPSRILHRVSAQESEAGMRSFSVGEKKIVVMDESARLLPAHPKPVVDVLVLSKNPKLYINSLCSAFTIRQVVIDGSVPLWKAALWKRDCDSLHLPWYSVADAGAFVMDW